MFPAKVCLVPLLILAATWPLAAQVHETEEPVDLTRALVLKTDSPKPDSPVADAAQTQVGSKDFAFSMRLAVDSPTRQTVLAAQGDDTQGWRFLMTADGAVRFEARSKAKSEPIAVATASGAVAPGGTHHFAFNILRDAAKPNAGIWLDGVELASGIVPPVDFTSSQPLVTAAGAQRIRLYHRSLSRPELLAIWLDAADRAQPAARHSSPPSDGPHFIPRQDETIALIGGTEAVALAESGAVETALLLTFPETRFHLRCLAWEGDTVFRQDRPLNFGDLTQQLQRVNAGAAFVMFGRQECLDAAHGARLQDGSAANLGAFKKAFANLLDEIRKHTSNIVVIGPPPLWQGVIKKETIALLHQYRQAMEEVAGARDTVFVRTDKPMILDGLPRTTDGVTLTPTGVLEATLCLADSLHLPGIKTQDLDPLSPIPLALRAKNRLWHDYWRPTNWAFLHGDRTQQPSSRDPVNPQLRFFPAEQEKYLPLIKEAEEKVYKLVDEATKKLP